MGTEVLEITDDNFEQLIESNSALVIDCWAPWCGPCRSIAPIIEKLAEKYDGKIKFAKLNTDENQKIAMKQGIMSIPTLLLYKEGKQVNRVVGALPEALMEKSITKELL